jgi:hypothetical protein
VKYGEVCASNPSLAMRQAQTFDVIKGDPKRGQVIDCLAQVKYQQHIASGKFLESMLVEEDGLYVNKAKHWILRFISVDVLLHTPELPEKRQHGGLVRVQFKAFQAILHINNRVK